MSCYHHLTIAEREKLYAFFLSGYSMRKIAALLGRSPSTISRELRRNPEYLPCDAQSRYLQRRKHCVRKPVLADPQLHADVHFWLGYMFWSPEQIANRLKHEGKAFVSTSTIYRALDSGLLQDTLRYYLRFKYKTHGKSKKSVRKCFARSIEQRPEAANSRSELGHWEGDTIVSRKSKTVIATLVDRKSRYLTAGKVRSKEAADVRQVVVHLLKKTGLPVKSITFDQGTEFAESAKMEQALTAPVFFSHPHSPWERPTNENTNGLLRQFIPKHRDLGDVSDEDLSRIVSLMNLRPRKCINWLTPFEMFSQQVLHFT